MKPKKRQKLCHNCEGEMDLDVIVCPFCAADLREEKPELGRPSFCLPPPSKPIHENQEAVQSLYPSSVREKVIEEDSQEGSSLREAVPAHIGKSKNAFVATTLFTLGVQLFLLGLLMLLFSHKGMIVLRWNAAYWFVYCLFGIPFLYFGYRFLSKL